MQQRFHGPTDKVVVRIRKLWVRPKRVQRIEIRIGRLDTRTVMKRTCGDQYISGGNCYPLGARPTCQIKGYLPNIIINPQFWEGSLKISKYGTLTLGPRAVPKLEPDQRAPTRFAVRQRTCYPLPNIFISLWP
jgi:hypothetical protein